jgi:hypothetical protein
LLLERKKILAEGAGAAHVKEIADAMCQADYDIKFI